MKKVRMAGIKIEGVKVSGTEVFEEEVTRLRGTKSSKGPVVTKRELCPAWVIPDSLSPPWPFNFVMSQMRKWWRFGVVSEELALMQCSSCEKSFAVMKEYHNGNAFCPYCKSSAHLVVDQEAYLAAMCKYLLLRDKVEYTEKRGK